MNKKLLDRLEEIRSIGQNTLGTSHEVSGFTFVDSDKLAGFKAAAFSFIEKVYGVNHSYYLCFKDSVKDFHPSAVKSGLEILDVIKQEISGDWLLSLKGLISAELFSDFIDMASYLLDEQYKDPAAVIIGSVLEQHIRQLCNANGIAVEIEKNSKLIPIKANQLNIELAKANVYSKLDQKSITAWLDLRNKAAHGEYAEYNIDQVQNMKSGIIEFMVRVTI